MTKPRPRNRTLNIRVTEQEIELARQIGNGNASHGYRLAVRWMGERSIRGIPLSTMLRAAAEMAAELERAPKRGAPPKEGEAGGRSSRGAALTVARQQRTTPS